MRENGCVAAAGVVSPIRRDRADLLILRDLLGHPFFQGMFEGGHEKTAALAAQYRAMADFMGVSFLDAGSVTATDGCDGIHFTAENNHALGKALAAKVTEILAG
jgi:lysophospholipase L1-like esterase